MRQALTFDDVLLVPAFSEVLPQNVDLTTVLTHRISLNIPFLSAAMDTVTESRLAISLARLGGMGVIHKNMTIADQVKEVDRVKRSESGMILDPITMPPTESIRNALDVMANYRISGVPVVDSGKLVGILTNRDIRFETNLDQPIAARMTSENLVTVKKGTTLEKAKQVLQQHRIEKLLVVDDTGSLCGLITVKDILKKEHYPNAALDTHGRLRVAAALGVGTDTLERAETLVRGQVDVLVIDTAHGHSKGVLEIIAQVKATFPDTDLIAGNVATPSGTQALIDAGVDAVKVGIGAGSSCTTRIVAGVGVPQLTAVLDAVEVAKKANIPVISDGGMRYSGDIAKSLACGANTVMLGSIFAGTDESPGETVLYEGRSFKTYRGMGSMGAMKLGSKDRYFQNEVESRKLVPEGIEGLVPYKGPLADSIHQLVGGLKASLGYCGASNISEFQDVAELVQITGAGVKESHPHDMHITHEAPNYQQPK